MMTVLFVILVLALSSKLLSVLDGQAASRDVASYLHYEYNMARDVRPTMTQLNNL